MIWRCVVTSTDSSHLNDSTLASSNGHVAEPADASRRDLNDPRVEWISVACWLAVGCGVLATSVLLPKLWARQSDELADQAVRFVAIALATLAAVFLPVFASRWRVGIINVLAAGVFTMLAGQIEGASGERAVFIALKLIGLLLGFATIWIAFSNWPSIRRFAWLALVLWTLGAPGAVLIGSETGDRQGIASTIPHFWIPAFLQ